MNLAGIMLESATRHPERPALRLGDLRVSYAELADASARVAGLLREGGIGPGDRVTIMLPNIPEFASVYFGALRLGAIVAPMNVLNKKREVAFLLREAGSPIIFAMEGMHEHAEAAAAETGATCVRVTVGAFPGQDGPRVDELAATAPDDTAMLLFTSGTTGSPKGAELTHSNLVRNAEISADMFGLGCEDVLLGALPLFHAFGQTCGLNTAMYLGASTTLLPRFDPVQALEMLDTHGVTLCLGVPTMYAAMLDRADGFPAGRLRFCVSGGSALPARVLHEAEALFGCPMLEGYGLTETSPVASFNKPGEPRKIDSIGTPLEDTEMRVVDSEDRDVERGMPGEILIRGHGVMKGYWNQPEATAHTLRGGWMHTGDLATVDEDGYYFIVDRIKDMIIRGGLNVYPREVEDVLHEHPAVRQAAVVRVPHPVLGEEVGAAIVLRDGAEATEKELRGFVRDEIAAYKYPRHIWFVDALPMDAMGKVRKREIAVPAEVVERAAARRG
ncbi:MAG TPA: long-chain fatty acid--CoA ligase [Solirubrobacteraceae bacterium]|nr:long-chain fatty acid--CoA ligase [Solirubrobacteraceae bacterium]